MNLFIYFLFITALQYFARLTRALSILLILLFLTDLISKFIISMFHQTDKDFLQTKLRQSCYREKQKPLNYMPLSSITFILFFYLFISENFSSPIFHSFNSISSLKPSSHLLKNYFSISFSLKQLPLSLDNLRFLFLFQFPSSSFFLKLLPLMLQTPQELFPFSSSLLFLELQNQIFVVTTFLKSFTAKNQRPF